MGPAPSRHVVTSRRVVGRARRRQTEVLQAPLLEVRRSRTACATKRRDETASAITAGFALVDAPTAVAIPAPRLGLTDVAPLALLACPTTSSMSFRPLARTTSSTQTPELVVKPRAESLVHDLVTTKSDALPAFA